MVLEHNVSVWFNVVIRADNDTITIGENSNIQDGSVLHTDTGVPLMIGANVTVGHKVMLHGCTIGDEVLVGIGTIVLDRAIIESQVLIGAGSLVPPNKRLESGYLYLGNPVKKVRPLTDEEKAYFKYSAEHYMRLAVKHKAGV